ncbi:hypothetical protein L210DRAFT_530937 [Boletus edulis BED1]|uniref:Uncharacterized protein n=1 Tax=Boletus edulis BED1 TaxID=1328754 RepID=A0AAD4C0E9_BOLED|nr:hypothetical protein L210DRAFT_530937 [Boletus edulis BED1]
MECRTVTIDSPPRRTFTREHVGPPRTAIVKCDQVERKCRLLGGCMLHPCADPRTPSKVRNLFSLSCPSTHVERPKLPRSHTAHVLHPVRPEPPHHLCE